MIHKQIKKNYNGWPINNPAHTSRTTQDWCVNNLNNLFLPKERWPANSPDLNQLDYYYFECSGNQNEQDQNSSRRKRVNRGDKKFNFSLILNISRNKNFPTKFF